MSLQDDVAKVFKGWGSELLEAERKALRKKAAGYSVSDWKAEHIAYVVGSGALTGIVVGGAVSAGINWWLLSGLLDAAEIYYKSNYIVLSDDEIASLT